MNLIIKRRVKRRTDSVRFKEACINTVTAIIQNIFVPLFSAPLPAALQVSSASLPKQLAFPPRPSFSSIPRNSPPLFADQNS
jgi:hypothetical protein